MMMFGAVLLQLQLFRIAIVAGVVVPPVVQSSCAPPVLKLCPFLHGQTESFAIYDTRPLFVIFVNHSPHRILVCDHLLMTRDNHVGCAVYSTGHRACFLWLRWAQCHRGLCDYTKQGVFFPGTVQIE